MNDEELQLLLDRMRNYAVVIDGVVVGVNTCTPPNDPNQIEIPEGTVVNIGDSYDGVNFIPQPQPIDPEA